MNPPAGEVRDQLTSCPMQPGLDGSDRPFQHFGDFLIRQAMLVEKDENGPVIGAKSPEGPVQFAGEVVGVGHAGAVVDHLLGRLGQDRPPGSPPERSPATIGGDSQQPGAERAMLVETANSAKGPDESLLDDILGILAMLEHPKAEAEDHAVISIEEEAWCSRIAGSEGFDQRSVIHEAWPSPDVRDADAKSDVSGYPRRGDRVSRNRMTETIIAGRPPTWNDRPTNSRRVDSDFRGDDRGGDRGPFGFGTGRRLD